MDGVSDVGRAWDSWYHCVGHTYGSWLPGDQRGWRSRHHRVHVEGDYKNPPPPSSDKGLHEHATQLMKRPAVVLNAAQRQMVLEVVRETLEFHDLPIAAVAVSATHAHLLGRFEPGRCTAGGKMITDPSRHFFGVARQRAARRLSDLGAAAGGLAPGGLWSKRSQIVPITDRPHFYNTRRYLLEHTTEGAAVWLVKVELLGL